MICDLVWYVYNRRRDIDEKIDSPDIKWISFTSYRVIGAVTKLIPLFYSKILKRLVQAYNLLFYWIIKRNTRTSRLENRTGFHFSWFSSAMRTLLLHCRKKAFINTWLLTTKCIGQNVWSQWPFVVSVLFFGKISEKSVMRQSNQRISSKWPINHQKHSCSCNCISRMSKTLHCCFGTQ